MLRVVFNLRPSILIPVSETKIKPLLTRRLLWFRKGRLVKSFLWTRGHGRWRCLFPFHVMGNPSLVLENRQLPYGASWAISPPDSIASPQNVPLLRRCRFSYLQLLTSLNSLFLLFASPPEWSLPVCDQWWLEDQHSRRVQCSWDKTVVPPLCGHLGELWGAWAHPRGSSSDGETSNMQLNHFPSWNC